MKRTHRALFQTIDAIIQRQACQTCDSIYGHKPTCAFNARVTLELQKLENDLLHASPKARMRKLERER